jgi:hypothetical protein
VPAASASSFASGDAGHACGPDHRAGRHAHLAVRPVHRRHAVAEADHGVVGAGRDAELRERALRLGGQRRRERPENPVERLGQDDARAGGVDRAEVAAQRVARDLADLPGHLHAGRAGANDHGRQPLLPALGVLREGHPWSRR